MHFAVRPSAVELLAPPQRLPLMAAALRRFFNWVIAAVVVTLLTGLAMFIGIGAAAGAMQRGQSAFVEGMRLAHPSIHVMRQLVALNLVLGIVTIAVATVGRALL